MRSISLFESTQQNITIFSDSLNNAVSFLSICQSVHPSIYYPFDRPSVCLSLRLSVHLFVCCPFLRLSIHYFIWPSIPSSVRPFLGLSVHSFVCLSIPSSVHSFLRTSVHPFVCPSIPSSFRPSLRLSVHPFVCQFIPLYVRSSLFLSIDPSAQSHLKRTPTKID